MRMITGGAAFIPLNTSFRFIALLSRGQVPKA
jgi:hypothetical protein